MTDFDTHYILMVFNLVWSIQEELSGEVLIFEKLIHFWTLCVKEAWANSIVNWVIFDREDRAGAFHVK